MTHGLRTARRRIVTRARSLSPEGDIAYVANGGSDNVSVIELATNTVAATLAAGDRPVGIAFMPTPMP